MGVRRRGLVGGVLGVAVLALGVGCAATRPDGPRVQQAIDELAAAEAPPGAEVVQVEVRDCASGVEMAGGYAEVTWDRPELRDLEAANAELARVEAWYRARWADRGWRADAPLPGQSWASPVKSVGGRELRAGIDGVDDDGFSIYVVRSDAGVCG